MEFRIAREKDLERMCEITAQAKAGLKNLGLDQWQKGYPSREIWKNDIKNQCTYVAEEDGIILVNAKMISDIIRQHRTYLIMK